MEPVVQVLLGLAALLLALMVVKALIGLVLMLALALMVVASVRRW